MAGLRPAGRRRGPGEPDVRRRNGFVDQGGRILHPWSAPDRHPRPGSVVGQFVAEPVGAAIARTELDATLGLRGGEDTQLTQTLTRAGERLLWCNKAEVIDVYRRTGWIGNGVAPYLQPGCGG